MTVTFTPIATETARRYQAGGLDAYGQEPERTVSDGAGNPCRHCLRMIPKGRVMLILAHRPFPMPQPYAETGPIFLCADPCDAPGDTFDLPEILGSPEYILRGYGVDDRIVYGTGAVVARSELLFQAEARLTDPQVAYLHVRSARNTCYQVRIDRPSAAERTGLQT